MIAASLPTPHARLSRWQLAALTAWFAVVVVLFLTLPGVHLRDDEELSYRTTSEGFDYTLWYTTYQDVHPPVWFSIFWIWRQWVGISEIAGRMQAVLFSMLTLAFVYRCGREWFGHALYGLFAVIACGVSAYHVYYALEIRPYALIVLFATISMWRFGRWMQTHDRRWALTWGAWTALMGYTHYLLGFLPILQVVYLLFAARPLRPYMVQLASAVLVGAVLWLPWLPRFISQIEATRAVAARANIVLTGAQLGTYWTSIPTTPRSISELLALITNGQLVLYGLLLVAGLVIHLLDRRRAAQKRQPFYGLALLWGVGVPALTLMVNLVASVYTPRYISYLTPGMSLAVGAALVGLGARWSKHPARHAINHRAAWVGLGVFVILVGTALPGYLPVRTPHRDIYRAMSQIARPDDAIYLIGSTARDPVARWQMEQYLDPPIYTHTLASLDGALPRRIWYITDDWFGAGIQDRFSALERTHPLQTVIGDCTRAWCYLAQLMEAPPQAHPQMFGDVLGFLGADIDQSRRDDLRLRLWWRVDTPPLLDYSIGLHVLAHDGTLIAHSDGPINHYGVDIIQTSRMQPGQIYIDHRALTLPADAPSNEYRLSVVVYQSWDGVRLPLPNAADHLIIGTLRLP